MWGFGKSGLGFGGGGGVDLGRKVGVFLFILMYLNARVEMGEVFNCMD